MTQPLPIILETAVQDDKVMQDFESEPPQVGGDHSQMVKAPPTRGGYGSKDCVNLASSTAVSRIITIDSPQGSVLKKIAEPIKLQEFPLAKEIAQALFDSLKPYLPAAGLAAPQIGISKSIFIYSYDRNPDNLTVVINPSFVPIGEETIEEWEGCFSVLLSRNTWQIAKIPRYKKIRITYTTLEGETIDHVLEGFAAKVFQHEYDHLQGVENIYRKDATVKAFGNKDELEEFFKNIKKTDAEHYLKPTPYR